MKSGVGLNLNFEFEFESAHELLMNLNSTFAKSMNLNLVFSKSMNLKLNLAFSKSMNLNLDLFFLKPMNLNLNLKIPKKINGSNPACFLIFMTSCENLSWHSNNIIVIFNYTLAFLIILHGAFFLCGFAPRPLASD